MESEDVVVLRELAGSVYLTRRQREALARLLGRELGGARVRVGLPAGGMAMEDVIAEDQRNALLGPCGAE